MSSNNFKWTADHHEAAALVFNNSSYGFALSRTALLVAANELVAIGYLVKVGIKYYAPEYAPKPETRMYKWEDEDCLSLIRPQYSLTTLGEAAAGGWRNFITTEFHDYNCSPGNARRDLMLSVAKSLAKLAGQLREDADKEVSE